MFARRTITLAFSLSLLMSVLFLTSSVSAADYIIYHNGCEYLTDGQTYATLLSCYGIASPDDNDDRELNLDEIEQDSHQRPFSEEEREAIISVANESEQLQEAEENVIIISPLATSADSGNGFIIWPISDDEDDDDDDGSRKQRNMNPADNDNVNLVLARTTEGRFVPTDNSDIEVKLSNSSGTISIYWGDREILTPYGDAWVGAIDIVTASGSSGMRSIIIPSGSYCNMALNMLMQMANSHGETYSNPRCHSLP